MKVYAVTIAQVSDYEDLGVRVELFSKHEDAVKYLKSWKEDELHYINRDGYDIEKDDDNHFVACLPMDWARGHSEGYIEEKEIN